MAGTKYYSIAEAAEKLGLSLKTIRRHIAAKTIDSVKIGGVYRIPVTAFNKFTRKGSAVPAKPTVKAAGAKAAGSKDEVEWCDISALWRQGKKKRKLTFVDLFSGAGGLTKGFELAGLQGACGLDIFEAAAKTYRRNFKHGFVEGDICKPEIKKQFYATVKLQLAKHGADHVDIVAGGFPCQGFSMAGHRIVEDSRNSLYREMLEIVRTLQPDWVVCENVVGLRSMLGGKVEEMIKSDFGALGYPMEATTLVAADYTVPQKRERVIFIGNRIGCKNLYPAPLLDPKEYRTTRSVIEDLMTCEPSKAFNHVPTNHRPDMVKRMLQLPEGKSLYANYSDSWKKCPWDAPSCTIKENHGGVNVHPRLGRVLTAREMARIQSFPDDFIFEGPKNKQLVQIGNAVPPLLGKAIALAIVKSSESGSQD